MTVGGEPGTFGGDDKSVGGEPGTFGSDDKSTNSSQGTQKSAKIAPTKMYCN